MNPDKAIAFDIWGRYAHFKKIYVTTSALTYSVPFKTSVYGMIGAVLGFNNQNNEYLSRFGEDKSRVAIQVINPISVQQYNINLSVSPGPIKGNRKPTMMEYLVNLKYRIYFWHEDDDMMKELKMSLSQKKTVFTPVLGLAHCLANFEFVGEFGVSKDFGNEVINSVIVKSQLKSFDTSFWENSDIHIQEQDMYPLEMNQQREVTKRNSILFDLKGKPIKAEVDEFYRLKTNDPTCIMLM